MFVGKKRLKEPLAAVTNPAPAVRTMGPAGLLAHKPPAPCLTGIAEVTTAPEEAQVMVATNQATEAETLVALASAKTVSA
jgi:hypothetical protein